MKIWGPNYENPLILKLWEFPHYVFLRFSKRRRAYTTGAESSSARLLSLGAGGSGAPYFNLLSFALSRYWQKENGQEKVSTENLRDKEGYQNRQGVSYTFPHHHMQNCEITLEQSH